MDDPASVNFGIVGTVATALYSVRRTKEFVDGIKVLPESTSALSSDLSSLAN